MAIEPVVCIIRFEQAANRLEVMRNIRHAARKLSRLFTLDGDQKGDCDEKH